MFARPRDLADDAVVAALDEHWSIDSAVEYAPVGFGSHHWMADAHFMSVDSAEDEPDLRCSLQTARALRFDAGLEFVIAPLPAHDGRLVVPVGDNWVMHVYDRLEVLDDTTHGPHDDPAVVELVQRIHDATPAAEPYARREDFTIWERDDLEEALGELDGPWETGPYGDRCRAELAVHAESVRAALQRHDACIREVPTGGWVLTHGEPHRGNVFRTTQGWAVVDWDTALLAPPERDWWDLRRSPGDASVRELYRFRWALSEVACYVSEFFDHHEDDRNTQESWQNFERFLEELIEF